MYVCICNGYRESELRSVAREGASTAEDAYLCLGEGPCCGRCLPFAQEVVDSERQAMRRETRETGLDEVIAGPPALCPA